jgi:two-component sensor histidine kinase
MKQEHNDLYDEVQVLDNLPIDLLVLDRHLHIIWVNKQFLASSGYAQNILRDTDFTSYVDASSRRELKRILTGQNFGVRYSNIPVNFRTIENQYHSYTLSTAPFQSAENPDLIHCVLTDIEEHQELEQSLLKNQQRLFHIQDIAQVGTFKLDTQDNTIWLDSLAHEILRVDDGEVRSLANLVSRIHVEDKAQVIEAFEEIQQVSNCQMSSLEFRLEVGEQYIWLAINLGSILREERPQILMATVQDITVRKKSEEAVVELKNRLEIAVDSAEIGIVDYNFETRQYFFSGSATGIFELESDRFNFLSMVSKEDRVRLLKLFDLDYLRRSDRINEKIAIRTKSRKKYLDCCFQVLKDRFGHPIRLVGAVVDITLGEMQKLQMQESLKENTIVFRELHHRVKSNLQLLSSILFLNMHRLENDNDRFLIENYHKRILRMARMHEYLLDHDNVRTVDIIAFVENVVYEFNTSDVFVDFEILESEESAISESTVETAMILGGLLSEIINNISIHGIRTGEKNRINVTVSTFSSYIEIVIKQPLANIPKNVLKSDGLGASIIQTLASKLDLELTTSADSFFIRWEAAMEHSHSDAASVQFQY